MGRSRYGTGHVYEKHGAWYGRWRERNGANRNKRLGPKRTEGSRDGLTKAQAERELRRVMDAPSPAERGVTVAELGRQLLSRLEARGNKRSSIEAIDCHLRIHIEPHFESTPVDAIGASDLERFMAKLRRTGLAPKTIKNVMGTMHSIFELALRHDLVPTNLCKLVDKPKVERSEDLRYLAPDDLELLLDGVLDDDRGAVERPLFLMAALTGLRQGELLALRWRDVDWLAGKVRVRQSYVRGEFGTPKSRRSSRAVPLALRLARELEELSKCSSFSGDDELVFAHPHTGRPLDRSKVLKRFKAACLRAGIGRTRRDPSGRTVSAMRFHDLRHTFGTQLAAQGVPLKTLQEWFGHRDSKTTDIYTDYAPSSQERQWINAAFATGNNSGNKLRGSEGV
jgi:integrase